MNAHALSCEAPICLGTSYKEVVWLPGEAVCSLKWGKLQRNQSRINRLVVKGSFKHADRYFTGATLERIVRVTSGTKGARF